MFNTGMEVYLGAVRGAELWRSLGIQAVWFAALAGACFAMMRAGVRRLVIQGG